MSLTYEEARKEFVNFINSYNKDASLLEIHNAFIIQKMKMDKYFSVFLDENEHEMNLSENYDSPAWKTYREKLKEYNEVERFVVQSRHYLNKNV